MRKTASFLLVGLFTICSFTSFAANKPTFSQGLASGQSSGQYANQRLGSKSALKSRILTPASSGGQVQMHSLNGQHPFSGSVSKPSGKAILEILIHPTSTGDLTPVYIYENTGSGNKYNYSYTVPFAVSGICANGLIRCNTGTWNNCKYYKWVTNSSGGVYLTQRPSTDFGGCYCINNSCGNNLAVNNASTVLKDIGGGAIGAIMQSGNYKMTVSGVDVNSVDIIYYGQIEKSSDTPKPTDYPSNQQSQYEWQSGSSNPSAYYSKTNGGYLFAAAGSTENSEKSNPNSLYNLIETSNPTKKNPVKQKTCYIRREIDVTKHRNDFYYGDNDTSCDGVRFDTSICKSVDGCYTDSQGSIHCVCTLSKTGGGCGETYNYTFCGKFTTHYHTPDDTYALIKIGSSTVLYKNAGTTGGTDPTSGTYTYSTNGSQKVLIKYYNLGGCNGTPSSYLKVFIYRKAWDTVSNEIDNQCKTYENDSNCTLKDEWVDGIRTWNNYASTGLAPVGQVCKTFNGWTPHTFCYSWWTKERVYVCKTNGYNFDKAKQRASTIINSTADTDVMSGSNLNVNYRDYRKTKGSWGYHNGSLSIPLNGRKNGCINVCKVKVPVDDTQAYANTNTSQYRKIQSSVFDYRKCTGNNGTTCPVDANKGETVVTSCQCIDEFAEAATIMQTLENAGKDIICSSGVKH